MEEPTAAELASKLLMGTEDATLDDKGRILISKKKRDRLGENFVLCLGYNGSLWIYPAESWARFVSGMATANPLNLGYMQFSRLMFGAAEGDMNCDQQGRVTLPKHLRDLANLKESVVLVGCGDHLEVYDAEDYKEVRKYPYAFGESRMREIDQAIEKMRQ